MVRLIFVILMIYLLYKVGRLLLRGLILLIATIYSFISEESQKQREKESLYQKERAWEVKQKASQHQAQGTLPSWMNSDRINDFNQGVYQILRSSGIGIEDAKRLLNHRNPYLRALYVAGRMERKGATYEEQKRAAGETLVALWQRADHQQLFSDHLE